MINLFKFLSYQILLICTIGNSQTVGIDIMQSVSTEQRFQNAIGLNLFNNYPIGSKTDIYFFPEIYFHQKVDMLIQ